MSSKILFLISIFIATQLQASDKINPDKVYDSAIKTILVHPLGNPLGMPVIFLNEMTPLQISFDDLNAQFQNYFYTVELVNFDWTPISMNSFDYIRGFNQNRITDFSVSSISIQSYYHYSFTFPNANCKPTQSGNYILKVYKSSNVNNVVFTKRFYVVDPQVTTSAVVQPPFDGEISKTHQKIKCIIDIKKLPYVQPNQLLVNVVQNYRYHDNITIMAPTFVRGNELEYNTDQSLIFPAGKEGRWINLQSLRLVSDRIYKFENTFKGTTVYVKPDVSRADAPYYAFKDLNGNFLINNSESLVSETQNDYAWVNFSYLPPERLPYVNQHLYMDASFCNNILNTNSEMVFNPKLGLYQKSFFLKQGYYSYNYILRDQAQPDPMMDFSETEGNHWETENNYTVFVYYRSPGARHDELIGLVTVNSTQNW